LNRYYKIKKESDGLLESTVFPTPEESEKDFFIYTREGDRLDILAYRYYKNPEDWYLIIYANENILNGDSLILEPGLRLRIPYKD